jgi:transcriptional regulator with XRE-family HTH domain
MMLIPPEQGRRIREIREARGISVAELGRLIGVSRSQIFRYETGQQPVARRLDAIAAGLGVEVADLLMKPGSPFPPFTKR